MSALAAACTLIISQTEVSVTEGGWREYIESEMSATPECKHYDIDLPPGVHLGEHKARDRFGDSTGRKVAENQWHILPRSLQDRGVVRVHLPELLGGDIVRFKYERIWTTEGPYRWEPGKTRPKHAELQAPADLAWETDEIKCEKPGKCWVSEPGMGAIATLRTPDSATEHTNPSADLYPTGKAVDVQSKVIIGVPPGDPQLRLYPGGGSIQHWQHFLAFAPEDRRRGYQLELPEAYDALKVSVEPKNGISYHVRRDAIVFDISASEGPARASISFDQPDAPTFGEVPEGVALEVEARDGLIQWERDQTWWLGGIHEKPVLPGRRQLEGALDYRFRGLAIPQPGLPTELRGRMVDWDLIGELRPTLSERARPATWPADPLFPRRLVKARKSGALTEIEAALIVWLYSRQIEVDAQWVLVHPATRGPGYLISPAGYERALVLVGHEGESRWIDPGCMVCGPFEVRPFLEGAAALGIGLSQTSAPTPGVWSTVVGGDGVRWELTGSAALNLRLWIDAIPDAARRKSLAVRMAGPGAELVDVEGVGEAGAPIKVTAKIGSGILTDPLSLPPLRNDGTTWVDTVGERWVRWAGRTESETEFEGEAIRYKRYVEDGDLIEVLTIESREIGANDIAKLDQARRADSATGPELEEGDAPPADGPSDGTQQSDPGEEGTEDEGAGSVGAGAEGDGGRVPHHESDVEEQEEGD